MFLYRALLLFLLPVLLVRLLGRAISNPRYFSGMAQRFGFGYGKLDNSPVIWIHAVSVGEVNAAEPLVKWIQEAAAGPNVLITTMTPTGADRVKSLFSRYQGYEKLFHCYLPYDYQGAVARFLENYKPQLAIVMETEIWPNLICRCEKQGIPLVYTNVRLSAQSYKGYRRFSGLFLKVLPRVDRFAVQNQADAQRIIRIGAPKDKVEVTGSIKFEIDLPPSLTEAAQSVRRYLGWHRPVWVVGSTHEGEESKILDAFSVAKKSHPELLMVIAPRHPERFSTVQRLCVRHGWHTVRRTQESADISEAVDIYLVDTIGELILMLAAGDFAFIGASMVPEGGHNLLEACSAGTTVIFGPHMFNFQEISDLVLARGAGMQVFDTGKLADVVIRLIEDPLLRDQCGMAGRRLVEENRGALDKIKKIILQLNVSCFN